MSANYQRFLKVLEKWPIDKTKTGRDLGEQIRKQIKQLTNPVSATTEHQSNLGQKIDALERLASNTYAKKYPRTRHSSATGLTAEQCTQVLSSEFLQYLNEDEKKTNK